MLGLPPSRTFIPSYKNVNSPKSIDFFVFRWLIYLIITSVSLQRVVSALYLKTVFLKDFFLFSLLSGSVFVHVRAAAIFRPAASDVAYH